MTLGMKMKGILAVISVVAALLAGILAFWLRSPIGGPGQQQPQHVAASGPAESAPPPTAIEPAAPLRPKARAASASAVAQPPPEEPPTPMNKAERLAQLRETFRAMAAGDPKAALRAAKQLTDETERETALLALVTEWKHGELDP